MPLEQVHPPREVPCQVCGKQMFVDFPILRVSNQPEFSQLLFLHTKLEKCPHCGTECACMIANAQNLPIEFAWAPIKRNPVQDPTQANILVRPQTNVKQ